jgi:hypothetical protein
MVKIAKLDRDGLVRVSLISCRNMNLPYQGSTWCSNEFASQSMLATVNLLSEMGNHRYVRGKEPVFQFRRLATYPGLFPP